MHGMIRQVDKKRPAAIFFHELQDGIRQAVTEIVAIIIEVLIFAEADVFRKDDSFEALSAGSHRASATASQIPHAEESGGIATVPQ